MFILTLFAAFSLADFKPEEKPIRGLNIDTAYVLPLGGVDARVAFPDVSIPLSVGIFDGLQLNSRTVLWFTQVRVPNVGLKWNLAKETENMPAFSIGGSGSWITIKDIPLDNYASGLGSLYETIDKVEIFYYNLSLYASKNFGYITASTALTYNKVNVTIFDAGSDTQTITDLFYKALKYFTGVLEPTSMFTASVVVHYEILQNLRLITEALVTLDEPYAYYLAAGLVLALGDNFRIDAGVIGARAAQFYSPLPHLGVGLNF